MTRLLPAAALGATLAGAMLPATACMVVHNEPEVVRPPGARQAPAQLPPGPPSGYVVREPVRCSGGQNVFLQGAYINTPGVAIQVSGGCDVRIENSQIVAGAAAVVVSGGGDVRVRGSLIQGSQASFALSGGADVVIENSRVVGPVQRGGGASLRDRGGNVWE
jgi:hypothetical protein